jgi:hypothetical protein
MPPRPKDEPIDFTRYAEVMAHLRWYPKESADEVVARLGLRRRVWKEAAARWSAARDEELLQGKTTLSERFGAVFARTRARLSSQRPPLASLGPLPGPDEVAPEPEPVAAPALVALPEPVVPPPVIQRISSQLETPPPARPAPSFLMGLREAPPSFQPAPVAPPPQGVLQPAPVLPLPQVVAAPAHLAGTMALGSALPIQGAKLPFEGARATPEQALASAIAHGDAVKGPVSRGRLDLGGTVGVSADASVKQALPFTGAHDAPVPALTLAQYASLRVELQQQTGQEAAVLARYGVPAASRQALDAHWRACFEADPLTRAEFMRAYAAYLAWLRQHQPQR